MDRFRLSKNSDDVKNIALSIRSKYRLSPLLAGCREKTNKKTEEAKGCNQDAKKIKSNGIEMDIKIRNEFSK